MIDKKLESNIKDMKKFLEFWSKFHEIYNNAIANKNSLNTDEENFLSTRSLVNFRFHDLMDSANIKPHNRLTRGSPIYEILSLESLSGISDDKLKRLEDCWTESFFYLSSILNRFQKKKNHIEKFNKFVFIMKNLIRRKGGKR